MTRTSILADKIASFWNDRFLPGWLPVLLGLALGGAAGVLIVRQQLLFLIPLAFIVPAMVLFLRYPFAAVIIWVLLVPFVIENPNPGGRLIYTVFHRMLIPTALGIAILSDWLRLRKREPVRFGRAELVMLCFLLLMAGNIILLTYNLPTTKQFIRLYDRVFVPFCAYWLIRLVAPDERDLRRVAWAAAFAVVAQVVIGLIGWFSPNVLPDYWLGREGQRTIGTLGNPAVYTSTLIFGGLFALRYAMTMRPSLMRAMFVGVFVMAYIGVFFSFSRGSWLGGLLVWAGVTALYPKLMRRLTILAVGAMLVAGIVFTSNLLSYANTRLEDTDTAEGRVLSANTQLNMIEEKPFLGWGYFSYDLYDEQFKQRVGNIAVRDSQTSHNQFLLMTTELGVIGVALYLFPIAWWLLLSVKVARRLPEDGMRSRQLVAMLWLLLLHLFIVNNFMEMFESYLFGTTIWWMALGLIASMIYPYLKPGDIGVPKWADEPIARLS